MARRWPSWALLLGLIAVPVNATEQDRPPRPNVVLMVLDACRADRMGFLGNERGLTRFLDTLSERAYVFRRAYTTAPYTVAAASLFSSRLPSQHGVTWFRSVLAEDERTLAEVLQEHGFVTGAFTGNVLFAGAEQGFETVTRVSESFGGGRARRVNAAALAWLQPFPVAGDDRAPTFLYLHYMDTHWPYAPPLQSVMRIARRVDPPDPARVNRLLLSVSKRPATPAELLDIHDVYDSAVFVADAELRSFFTRDGLAEFFRHTVVIVTADHGELLGEHGLFGHGDTLHEEAIRIPLLVALPGQSRRVNVDEPISLIDVAPTVLDLLGLPLPPAWEGRSFASTLWRDEHPWRPASVWSRVRETLAGAPFVVSESLATADETRSPHPPLHRRAIMRGDQKAVLHSDGTRSYYDLRADPKEASAAALTATACKDLDRTLDRLEADARRRSTARQRVELDEATRERLRALGYVTD